MKIQKLPILAIRNNIIFPGVMVSITVGRKSSQKLIRDAKKNGTLIGIVGQRDPSIEEPEQEDLFPMGTAAKVLELSQIDGDDKLTAKIHGIYRFELLQVVKKKPYLTAEIREISEFSDKVNSPATQNLLNRLKKSFIQIVQKNESIPRSVLETVKKSNNPSFLTDLAATYLELSTDEKEQILETVDIPARLNLILNYFQRELQKLKVNEEVKKELAKLAEKFASIAEKDKREERRESEITSFLESFDQDDDEDEYRELQREIKNSGMPEPIQTEALKELKRLSRIPLQSAEYNVTKTYLEYLLELPWDKLSKKEIDLQKAQEVLEAEHYGLQRVKKRILEYLAVSALRGDLKAPILCFVGPPGVGKTSLGRSIARALGRKYHRISLGGVRDEAEIRGHRRTYIGALPGRIIQALRKVQTRNPVIVLDEIDKLGSDPVRGDPSSALLEVLDPEQNNEFVDHYIGHPFDLSQTMFIATANNLQTIPPALKDRLEIIEIPGYTEEEKIEIAKKFLLPKQLRENGLPPNSVKINKQTLLYICRNYTAEAGVRNFERTLANICRGLAIKFVNSQYSDAILFPITVTKGKVVELLGPPKYLRERKVNISSPGTSIALAWTPHGGELLSIETTKMRGSGRLLLTGQLGDVMKESAQACLSYLKSNSKLLKIRPESFENCDIHIHVPAGAVPKEGPSAGVALLIALYSLFTNRKVRDDIAMTGEISLHGDILPVGGIREKLLAAHHYKIREVIIPKENEPDLLELPPYLEKKLKIYKIKSALEAIAIAFKKHSPRKKKRTPNNEYSERKKRRKPEKNSPPDQKNYRKI